MYLPSPPLQYDLNIIKHLLNFYLKKSTITKQNGSGHVTRSGSGSKPTVYLYLAAFCMVGYAIAAE